MDVHLKRWPSTATFAGALLVSCFPAHGTAMQGPGAQSTIASETPKQIAIAAIEGEVKLIQYEGSYLRYKVHVKDAKGDFLRDVIESKDGSVSRILMQDERPVSPERDEKERDRLQQMLDSPGDFQKHIDKDRAGKKLAIDLLRLMPEAMLFTYSKGEPQRRAAPGGGREEIVLDFKPMPGWKPPTMAADALTGIQGRCWVDAKTHYLIRMEANIFQGLDFGWGIFAHIFPGGTLTLEQTPVGDSRWIVERFTGHLTIRQMMVRTVTEDTEVHASGFTAVPAMSYKDAIMLLLGGHTGADRSSGR